MKFRYLLIVCLFFIACKSAPKTEEELTDSEVQYIKNLGLITNDEEILLFDSQSDFETSGNFFTNLRIASYWISDRAEECDTNSAFFKDVDSLQLTDLVNDFANASYITVYVEDGTTFHVYIDADSAATYEFYTLAKENWEQAKF